MHVGKHSGQAVLDTIVSFSAKGETSRMFLTPRNHIGFLYCHRGIRLATYLGL